MTHQIPVVVVRDLHQIFVERARAYPGGKRKPTGATGAYPAQPQ